MSVSIHASAMEATWTGVNIDNFPWFQSTPPQWRRPALQASEDATVGTFQSTPPQWRRPRKKRKNADSSCFNPRLRNGGDSNRTLYKAPFMVSIHASAMEAT